MSDFPTQARTVIIGGGAVGTSCLYHLAKAGMKDCVLLEKNELTAGSTWHAAGNVPTFSASWSMMNLQRYSTELYRGLAEEVDYPMNYHVTGSVRLAHSKNRMQEFERAKAMGQYQGMDIEVLAVSEIQERYPFLELHDLEGALYDPMDGDIDPAQLTQALAKGARQHGGQIIRFCSATGIEQTQNGWRVLTEKGNIECEYVVNAAGYYAKRVASWFIPYGGRELPMAVMSHQYMLSEPVAELEQWSKEHAGKKLPILRDVDSSYYLRQEKFGFNLGPYELNCKAHWVDEPVPDDFSFQLFEDDLDRLEWYITDAMERVPLLGTSGISKVINGPIPYTPDGMPLIGPMPGVKNAFEACVFTFGIAQSGGAGKVLAEWIIDGGTEWDMWSCDPRRYTDYTDPEYCHLKALEVYGHEYAMHYPYHRWPAAADRKLSANHESLQAQGAQFGDYNGWERANWFAKDGDDTSEEATLSWKRKGPWEPRIAEECAHVRDHVGVLDLAGFSRFNLSGEGAANWLRTQICGALPKVGRMNLAYFADERGRLITEMSVMRHAEDHMTLITAASAQWHDFDLLNKYLPDYLSLSDHTKEYSTLIVSGPKSRDLFAGLCDADLSLPWLSVQDASIAGVSALMARVSFAGELGWEVHARIQDIPVIYEAILNGGAKPFGMFALDCLRIEKGYRTWKGDLSSDYSILQAGLDRFVKWDKPDFRGKAAMQSEHQQGLEKQYVCLVIDTEEYCAPYMSNLWLGDTVVGETTSGAWGYRVQKNIALGMIRSDLAKAGQKLEVDIYGTRYTATVQENAPLWDSANERIRR